jgi:hypothetical protein
VCLYLARDDAGYRAGLEAIVFHGQVWSVKTRVDGGIVVSIDLPETEVMQAAEMMELKRAGAYLQFTAELCEKESPNKWVKSKSQ